MNPHFFEKSALDAKHYRQQSITILQMKAGRKKSKKWRKKQRRAGSLKAVRDKNLLV
jgi:hypothetical protein